MSEQHSKNNGKNEDEKMEIKLNSITDKMHKIMGPLDPKLRDDIGLSGVLVSVSQESLKKGEAYIAVDITKGKDVHKPGFRNFNDKGDASLDITTGADTLTIDGGPDSKDKSYKINLPKAVEETMLRLAGEAQQGNYVARQELGKMVRQVVADVTKGGTKVER